MHAQARVFMPTPTGYLTTSVRLAVNLSLQQHEVDSELRNEKKMFFKSEETVLFFSVQNVEAEDGNDNWDDGWYGGRVSSSVVVHERGPWDRHPRCKKTRTSLSFQCFDV